MPDDDAARLEHEPAARFPLVQREVALFAILCVIAVGLFFLTRSLAGWSRQITRNNAAMWYDRGQAAVRDGNVPAALAAFRRAVSEDRNVVSYQLALARTLAGTYQDEEAEQILLRLRDLSPDDIEINYRLGRIAGRNGRLSDALRYYNHALYGIDHDGVPPERYRIRSELITLLLNENDRDGARDEINALVRELPDRADAHVQAARLAQRLPDNQIALRELLHATDLDPQASAAPAEAGSVAMTLGDFATAERVLEIARTRGAVTDRVTRTLEVARLARLSDPLGPRVRAAERARRLKEGLAWALSRLDACAASDAGGATPADADLRGTLQALRQQSDADLSDPDAATESLARIGQAETTVAARCRLSEPRDEAWIAVSHAHAGGGS